MFDFWRFRDREEEEDDDSLPPTTTTATAASLSFENLNVVDTDATNESSTTAATAPSRPDNDSSLLSVKEDQVDTDDDDGKEDTVTMMSSTPKQMSFEKLLRQTCLEKQSLVALVRDISLAHYPQEVHTRLPLKQDVVLSTDQQDIIDDKIQTAFQKMYAHHHHDTTTSTPLKQSSSFSLASTLYSTAASAAYSMFTSPFKLIRVDGGDDDDDDDLASLRSPTANEMIRVGPQDAIVNVDLAVDCLEVLANGISKHPAILTADHHSNDHRFSWNAWLDRLEASYNTRSTISTIDGATATETTTKSQTMMLIQFLKHLPHAETTRLWRVLENCQLLQKIERNEAGQRSLLVMGNHSNEQKLQVQLARFDLKFAQDQTERQKKEYESKVRDFEQRALLAKRKGDMKRALAELKRCKLYKDRIDKCDGTLMNIESSLLVLESSVENQTVLKTMEQASKTLRSLREGQELENLDDILDNHAEELEHAQDFQDTLSSHLAMTMPVEAMDEDALLQELQALTLESESKEETSSVDACPNDKVGETSQSMMEMTGDVIASMDDNNDAVSATTLPQHDADLASGEKQKADDVVTTNEEKRPVAAS